MGDLIFCESEDIKRFDRDRKHEKIERMASKIFIEWNTFHEPKVNPATAWENAEEFYNYAEEREEENV